MYGVLLAFLGTREIKICTKAIRNGKIGLEDAAEHFLIKLFLKSFGGAKKSIRVGILRMQIGQDFRIFFFAEPGVVVDATVTMENVLDRMAAGERRLRSVIGRRVGRSNRQGDFGVRMHVPQGLGAARSGSRAE